MRNYDFVFFDLDGTLLDSKPGVVHSIDYALNQAGVPHTQEILDGMVGPPFRVSMKEFLGLDDQLIESLITIYRDKYSGGGWRECKVYDGVFDMLKSLRAAGKTLAIATSKPIKYTSVIVDEMGLAPYFDFVGGATSDSSRDSKADVIRYVLDGLKISDKSNVLMVGDRKYDVLGAKLAGVDCAAILWGYGSEEELKAAGAEYILDTPRDLASALTARSDD